MTATTELVVPRSMPITFAMASRFLSAKPCRDDNASACTICLLRRRITQGRWGYCDANLNGANDTFSHDIPRQGNAQDPHLRHIPPRLHCNCLMPAPTQRLSPSADLSPPHPV